MLTFTIYDTVAQRGGNLFMTNTMGEAERQFKDAIIHAQEGSLFKTHPESFQLWQIGIFDPAYPEMESITPNKIMEGKDALSDIISDTMKQNSPEGN